MESPRVSKERRPRFSPWIAALCVVLALLIVRLTVVAPYSVPSGSMEPALTPGDLFVSSVHHGGGVERGDIAVFDGSSYFASDNGSTTFVKRVIGIGGDHVRCCDSSGQIQVNGATISEPYLYAGDQASIDPFNVEVPPGKLFLLGDHRSQSADSRAYLGAPGGGMIPLDRVQAVGVYRIWPLTKAGVVH